MLAFREFLGKQDMLIYLVGPGEQRVHPVESDGGDLLGLLENAVVLHQNAALGGQIQHDGDHSRHRQPQPQGTSTIMPRSTTQQTEKVGILISAR